MIACIVPEVKIDTDLPDSGKTRVFKYWTVTPIISERLLGKLTASEG